MSHISRLNPTRKRREGRGRIWTKCDKLEGRLSGERETPELSGLGRSIEEQKMKGLVTPMTSLKQKMSQTNLN